MSQLARGLARLGLARAADASDSPKAKPVLSRPPSTIELAETGSIAYDQSLHLLEGTSYSGSKAGYDVSPLSNRGPSSNTSTASNSSQNSSGSSKSLYMKVTRFSPGAMAPGCRTWIVELLTFAGWALVGVPSALQPPLLWFVFWQYVCRIGGGGAAPAASGHVERVIARKALPLWLLWALAAYYYR
jgi:hypothetical protein